VGGRTGRRRRTTAVAQDLQAMPYGAGERGRRAAEDRSVEYHGALYASREFRSLAARARGVRELPCRCADQSAKFGCASSCDRDLPYLPSLRRRSGGIALLRVPHVPRPLAAETGSWEFFFGGIGCKVAQPAAAGCVGFATAIPSAPCDAVYKTKQPALAGLGAKSGCSASSQDSTEISNKAGARLVARFDPRELPRGLRSPTIHLRLPHHLGRRRRR